ncbi:MAG: hypothetical protein WCP39_04200 [Chlamydiota bacterium]
MKVKLFERMPYTTSPLDIPLTKSLWDSLQTQTYWKPWENALSQVLRVALCTAFYPVECFGKLTLGNLVSRLQNISIDLTNEEITQKNKEVEEKEHFKRSKQIKILAGVVLAGLVISLSPLALKKFF